MTLRQQKAILYPRKHGKNRRGDLIWVPDRDNPIEVWAGFTADRTTRAEVVGNVDVEVYMMRVPLKYEGLGPGAIVRWGDADWDCTAPPFKHQSRSRRVRHQTVEIRRRPMPKGERA